MSHATHCNQGEYVGSCKYGDDDCPELYKQDHRLIKSAKSARDGNVTEAIPEYVNTLYQKPWVAGEMPEDIDYTASEIVRYNKRGDDPEWMLYKAISRAILAERDACAKIAESFLRGGINYDYDYESGSANGIAAAIRRR